MLGGVHAQPAPKRRLRRLLLARSRAGQWLGAHHQQLLPVWLPLPLAMELLPLPLPLPLLLLMLLLCLLPMEQQRQ